MKEYNVTYFIKANNTETKYEMVVAATTAAYACKRLKELVKNKYQRNAFRPHAVLIK